MKKISIFLIFTTLTLIYQNCSEFNSFEHLQQEQNQSGGQTDDNDSEQSPVTINKSEKLISALGSYCHLTEEGDAYCWANIERQEREAFKMPVKVNIDLPIVDIHMSYDNLVFIDIQGQLHCINEKRSDLTPESFQSLDTCPFMIEDNLTSFGINELDGSYCFQNSSKDVFCNETKINNLNGQVFKEFVVNYNRACGLETAGDVYCWSMRYGGVATVILNTPSHFTAIKLSLPEGVTQMTMGRDGNCFLLDSKKVSCSGIASEVGIFTFLENNPALNSYTNENNFTRYYTLPITMPNLQNIKEIYSSLGHTCALDTSGELSCWGRSQFSLNMPHIKFENQNAPEHYFPVTKAHQLYQGMDTVRFGWGSMCGLKDGVIICDGVTIEHEQASAE